MAVISTIDPVTRLEGHLKIEVSIDTVRGVQQVVDARATGTLFRGFESILVSRHPWDAQHITERICGVCPVAHGLAAVMALDNVSKIATPANGRIMRNMVLGANFIQSHILHFYHLALQDFVDGPNMPPWQPSWGADKRMDKATTDTLVGHYVQALDMRRSAHEMGAIFGAKLPHPPAFIPGGMTTKVRADRIADFKTHLADLIAFIDNVYLPDVELLASVYNDYLTIGRGPGNLLAYGVFDQDSAGNTKLLKRGRVSGGSTSVQTLDLNAITEQVTYSWYSSRTNNLKPSAGVTTPQYPKPNAYSWLKAPRYSGQPQEVGALARMWINGDYRYGIGVMHRHRARAYEAQKIAYAMKTWVSQLQVGQASSVKANAPTSGTGYGLTEAARGALGHWVQISGSKIARYQIITPTCWNASPRDGQNHLGPIEQALIGTPVGNIDEPVEVVRVIHSFDPCLSCAVHVTRPSEGATIFSLSHVHGEEEVFTHTHDHGDGKAHSH